MSQDLFDLRFPDVNYYPLEVFLKTPDDFLKIRETLSRIGVASRKDNTLYQSCHILHKQGRYFITGFKELFVLDGKATDLSNGDIQRRNAIAHLLDDWGLLEIINPEMCGDVAPMSQIKVLSFGEKIEWNLVTKYTIGKKK